MKVTENVMMVDDRNLAAWFIAHGHPVKGHGLSTNGRFVEFYFEKSEQLDRLKEDFQVNTAVPIKTLLSAQDEIWNIIKQQRSGT